MQKCCHPVLSDKIKLEYLNIEGIQCSVSAFEIFLRLMFEFRLKYLQMTNSSLQFSDYRLSFECSKKMEYSDQQPFLLSILNYIIALPVTVRTFIITGVHLGEDCRSRFRKLLSNSKCSMKSLILVKCSHSFLEALNPTIDAITLKSFYLQHSPVGPVMIKAFRSLLVCCRTLKKLYIRSSDIGDKSISEEITSSLQTYLKENQHLELLGIKPCPANIVRHLREGLLQNSVLQSIDLSGNIMTDSEQTKLIGLILSECPTLLSLDLSKCSFPVDSINDIASGIVSNTRLNCLKLDCLNIIGTKYSISWHILFSSLKRHVSIHTLSVCKNKLDFEAVEELIQHNKVIRTLKCNDCGFSETQLQQIADQLSLRVSNDSTQSVDTPDQQEIVVNSPVEQQSLSSATAVAPPDQDEPFLQDTEDLRVTLPVEQPLLYSATDTDLPLEQSSPCDVITVDSAEEQSPLDSPAGASKD